MIPGLNLTTARVVSQRNATHDCRTLDFRFPLVKTLATSHPRRQNPRMDHVALITGASRGIGAAIARRLASEGVTVVLAARSSCDALVAELEREDRSAHAVSLDVSDPLAIARVAEDVTRSIGPIDWLVNNAGIAESAPWARRPQGRDLYDEHLTVNFHGPRLLCEALVPGMAERGYGRVVNVASSAGLRGYAYVCAYVASKHALVGYTRALALELADSGVAVGAVCPHYVDTALTAAAVERVVSKTGRDEEDVRAFFASQNPGGRLVTPEEVAQAVWELCLDDRSGRLVEISGEGTHPV